MIDFNRRWKRENPRWMSSRKTTSKDHVQVWAGIIGDRLIGPYFFPGTVSGDSYYTMLKDYAVPQIIQLGMDPKKIIYAHDGAPAHIPVRVRDFLIEKFEGFIGRGEGALIEWPARSCDFNPCDIFLWSHTKNMVYQERSSDRNVMENKIDEAFDFVSSDHLRNTFRTLVKRFKKCIEVEGGIFEHLLEG